MRRRYENGGDKKPGVFRRVLNQLKANKISKKNLELTKEEEDRIENPEKYFEQQKQELHSKYGDLIDERGYIIDKDPNKINTEDLKKDIRVWPNPIMSDFMKNVFNPMDATPRNYVSDLMEYYTDPNSLAGRRYSGEFMENTPFLSRYPSVNNEYMQYNQEQELLDFWKSQDSFIDFGSRFVENIPRKSWKDQKNLFTGALGNLTFLGQQENVVEQQKHLAAFYKANPDILNYKDITDKYDSLEDFIDSEGDKYPDLVNAIYSRRLIGDSETTGGYAWPMQIGPNEHKSFYSNEDYKVRTRGGEMGDYGYPFEWDDVGAKMSKQEIDFILRKYNENPDDPKWKDLLGTITVSPYMNETHPEWVDNIKSTLSHELGHHAFSHYLPEREKEMLNDLNFAGGEGGHLGDTEETHADMGAIRQDMLDKGIYDYRTEQMTSEHWQEYLDSFDDGKLTLPLERFLKRYRIPEYRHDDPKFIDQDMNIRYLMNVITEKNKRKEFIENYKNVKEKYNIDDLINQQTVTARYGGRMTRTGDPLMDTLKFRTRSNNYRVRAKYGHSRPRARHGGRFGLSSRGDVPRFEYGGSTPPTSTNEEPALMESLMALKPQNNGDEKKIKKFSKEWYNNYLNENENKWFTNEELNNMLWKENYLQLQDGDPRTSSAGAFGIAQTLPRTWNMWIERGYLPEDADPNDPVVARYFQATYLDWLMDRPYIVDAPNANEKKYRAMLAYNMGHGTRFKKYFKNNPNKLVGSEDNPGWGYDTSLPREGRFYSRYILDPVQFRKENPIQGGKYDGYTDAYCITCSPTKRNDKGELLWTNWKDYKEGRNKHQPSEFGVDWGYQLSEGYEDRKTFFENTDMNFRYNLD
jgi:hypothetical protein